jgi:hypothetical protein
MLDAIDLPHWFLAAFRENVPPPGYNITYLDHRLAPGHDPLGEWMFSGAVAMARSAGREARGFSTRRKACLAAWTSFDSYGAGEHE